MIFVEAPAFERHRERYLDEDRYRLLQAALLQRPDSGDLIPGSGGLRKVRWVERGRGKRGGIRVIYCWMARRHQILLLTVYRKSEMANLSKSEIRLLRDLVNQLSD